MTPIDDCKSSKTPFPRPIVSDSVAIHEENEHDQEKTTPRWTTIDAEGMKMFEDSIGRPRRNSLECHADEDDFVICHVETRKADRARAQSAAQTPAQPKTLRGQGTPKLVDSSRTQSIKSPATEQPARFASPAASTPKIPRGVRALSMTHELPGSLPSRDVSRGRQRHTRWEADEKIKAEPPRSPEELTPFERWERSIDYPPKTPIPTPKSRRTTVGTHKASNDILRWLETSGSLSARKGLHCSTPSLSEQKRDHSRGPSLDTLAISSPSFSRSIPTEPSSPEETPRTPKAIALDSLASNPHQLTQERLAMNNLDAEMHLARSPVLSV